MNLLGNPQPKCQNYHETENKVALFNFRQLFLNSELVVIVLVDIIMVNSAKSFAGLRPAWYRSSEIEKVQRGSIAGSAFSLQSYRLSMFEIFSLNCMSRLPAAWATKVHDFSLIIVWAIYGI